MLMTECIKKGWAKTVWVGDNDRGKGKKERQKLQKMDGEEGEREGSGHYGPQKRVQHLPELFHLHLGKYSTVLI